MGTNDRPGQGDSVFNTPMGGESARTRATDDEDVEGHKARPATDDEDVEGHKARPATDDEDVEGHSRTR